MSSNTNRELPASDFLGYSLDLTAVSLFDLETVFHAVKKNDRLFKLDLDDTRPSKLGDVTYDVPDGIYVSEDVAMAEGAFVIYQDGTKARDDFRREMTWADRYLAVVTSDPTLGTYPLERFFRAGNQFAFFSRNSASYLAQLQDYAGQMDEEYLVSKLEGLPEKFSPTDWIIDQYRAFFDSVGTHVILKTMYGARFQLNVWASNDVTEVNDNFFRDVAAGCDGIVSRGDFDHSVLSEEQYATFLEMRQQQISVEGGDPALRSDLKENPPNYAKYDEWMQSIASNPGLISIHVGELWTLMLDADSEIIRQHADAVENAYIFFISNSPKIRTPVLFEIEAPWAEFGLLTPTAVINVPEEWNTPEIVATQTKVKYGDESEPHQDKQKYTFSFLIENDGSPIDFYLSLGRGKATITIFEDTYVNVGKNKDGWNTKYFYQVVLPPGDSEEKGSSDSNAG